MEIGAPVILNFGGGVNSTALILEMVARGERFDFVIFADTGGEKPHHLRPPGRDVPVVNDTGVTVDRDGPKRPERRDRYPRRIFA